MNELIEKAGIPAVILQDFSRLIRETQRIWEGQGINYTWPEMISLARTSEPFKFLINPDDSMFLNPGDMTQAIRDFCYQTAQGTSHTHGEVIRCIYDSLALKYRFTLEQIREVSDQPIEVIHIIPSTGLDWEAAWEKYLHISS